MAAKRKNNKPNEQLTPEEQKRRELQRKLQTMAMKLRTEGGIYKPQKHKRKAAKEQQVEAGRKPTIGKAKNKKEKKSKHDTPKWRPLKATDVVVLPIYWNMHHEEKAKVLAAAKDAASLLEEAGISCTTDAANQYTPGQKMKYWETAGVRVRVEIGPKEAMTGAAIVARAGLPGTVAKKKSVNMTVQLVSEIKTALAEAKAQAPDQEGVSEPDTDDQQDEQEDDDQLEPQADMGSDEQQLEQEADRPTQNQGNGVDVSEDDDVDSDEGLPSGLSKRELKKLKKQKAKQAKKAEQDALAGGENVKEGSRRDRKRKAKALQEAKTQQAPQPTEVSESGEDSPQDANELAQQSGGIHSVSKGSKTADGKLKQEKTHVKPSKALEMTADDNKQDEQQQEDNQQAETQQQEGSDNQPGAVDMNGDDLTDDFQVDDAFLAEPEEDVLTMNKTQRIKKARKTAKELKRKHKFDGNAKAWDANEADETAGSRPSKAGGAKKKAKVVVF